MFFFPGAVLVANTGQHKNNCRSMDALFLTQCQPGLAGGYRDKGGLGMEAWRRYVSSPPQCSFFSVQQGLNILFPLFSPWSCKEQGDLPWHPSHLLQTCPAPGHQVVKINEFNTAAPRTYKDIRGIA